MDNLDLQLWTRIGTINRGRSAELLLGSNMVSVNVPRRSAALRFMESFA